MAHICKLNYELGSFWSVGKAGQKRYSEALGEPIGNSVKIVVADGLGKSPLGFRVVTMENRDGKQLTASIHHLGKQLTDFAPVKVNAKKAAAVVAPVVETPAPEPTAPVVAAKPQKQSGESKADYKARLDAWKAAKSAK